MKDADDLIALHNAYHSMFTGADAAMVLDDLNATFPWLRSKFSATDTYSLVAQEGERRVLLHIQHMSSEPDPAEIKRTMSKGVDIEKQFPRVPGT